MTTPTRHDIAVSPPPEEALPPVARKVFDEMERSLQQLMQRDWLSPFRWEWPLSNPLSDGTNVRLPAVDVLDQSENFLVRAELPGVDKHAIEITITDHSLTIRSKGSAERAQSGEYLRCEISSCAFSRTLVMPGGMDANKVSAKLKDGILEIVLPKANGSRRQSVVVD